MSLLLSDESISLIILFWFLVLSLVIHGASYNYDLESNGSFGHHFFHIKTRSSAEHNKIANRERSKWFSRVFPT